jgi:CheY-like chemotaxis protein
MKVLIVEDQKYPLEVVQRAVEEVFPKYYSEYSSTIVRSYNDAKEQIEKEIFDIIFLDHRLPYDDLGDLEDKDFDKFSDSLRYIGYSLIETIKKNNPSTVVIGTSSEAKKALLCGTPGFTMRKRQKDAVEDLEKIYNDSNFKILLKGGDKKMKDKNGKTVVLISYNSVKGFDSGWHGEDRVYVCANDQGRARVTGNGRTDKERAGSVMHKISNNYYHGSVPVENVKQYIVYSGLNALDSAIYMAKDLSKQAPDVPVTVAACGCSWGRKEDLLRGTNISLEGCECGGASAMGRFAQNAMRN